MPFPLLPTYRVDSITELTVDMLKARNIRLLMLDFDNTIVPYTTDVPTEQMADWLQRMGASDITLCIVSNSHNDRVPAFCSKYGLHCITHAKKPFSKGIMECINRFGVSKKECALAGDQIFTDTLGAGCAGIRSILVRAIDNHNFWLKLRHIAELPFIYLANNRRI